VSKRINQEFNSVVNANSEDVIDIQYHTIFPGDDPFYDLSPWTSDARELYYSLYNQNVPYAFIDGGRNGMDGYVVNYRERKLEQQNLTKSVLEDNVFKLDLKTDITFNSLTIDIEIEALNSLGQKNVTLQVAILENIIKDVVTENGETRFESVLKDMYPNSQGTSYTRNWNVGDKEVLDFEWMFLDVFDDQELRVVAFIQDDQTKEVYQAAFSNPYAITAIEDREFISSNNMIIYPNPAIGNVAVKFRDPLKEVSVLNIMDNTGRIIYTRKLYGSEQLIDIPLNGIKAGLYIVRLSDNKNILCTEKLIIIENN
jgi:hypothetical protein